MKLAAAVGLLLALGMLAASEPPTHVWIEGESPDVRPALPATLPADGVVYGASMGLQRSISQGGLLRLSIADADTAQVPEGLAFGYDFVLAAGGRQQVWARIGYESVRSPIRWRLDGGAWSDLAPTTLTVEVTPLHAWCELGWALLGEVELPAGRHRIDLAWPRPRGADDKARRILGLLDAICIAPPGVFAPHGPWRPGQDHRGDADRAAAAQIYRLPGAAGGGERSAVDLNGAWEVAGWNEPLDAPLTDRLEAVASAPPAEGLRWFAYQVPGDRNAQRPEDAFQHRFIARCRVEVPADLAGRSFLLDVQRFSMIATVFVNGVRCGWSRAHSTAWQPDLTPGMRPGQVNEIAIVFKDRYYALNPDYARPAPKPWISFRNLPPGHLSDMQGTCAMMDMAVANDPEVGLTGPVSLIAAGPAYVADCFVKTSVARKEIALEVTVRNPGPARTVALACEARPWSRDGDGPAAKRLAPATVALAAGETRVVELREPWADPRLWWPDDVHLYHLVATVSEAGVPADVSRTRFGFREWTWDDHRFRLNGAPWQLWGDLNAYTDPVGIAKLRERSGQNVMRLATRQRVSGTPRRRILEQADELGVCVRSSGTFNGEHCDYIDGLVDQVVVDGKKTRAARKAFFDHWREQLAAWVRAERNHPSVMIWSVENEVVFINAFNFGMAEQVEPEMRTAIAEVMRIDPTRPAMVDGGNVLKDMSLPVNGSHYCEFVGAHLRDLPDAAYTREHWYLPGVLQRGRWPMAPDKPIFFGETCFAAGWSNQTLATFGGETCFAGGDAVIPALNRVGRIFNEGWRWAELAAWQHWMAAGSGAEYWNGWQPVAVLCRQWGTTFGPGQQARRQLLVSNNSSRDGVVTARWELAIAGGRVAGGSRDIPLGPGASATWDIGFAIPPLDAPAAGTLTLTAERGGAEVFRDRRDIRVLVPARLPRPRLAAAELAVWDPAGGTLAWLATQGIPCTAIADPAAMPAGARVLVVGSDAISPQRSSDPGLLALARRGLRVVVLDQRNPLRYRALPADLEPLDAQPSAWERMEAERAGRRPELRGRFAFAEDPTHPAIAGLGAVGFATWGDDHVVYRNPYRKGTAGFHSLVQCEEGLSCTALAECPVGDGLLLLSQLAIGGKLAHEAVAQQAFLQFLAYAADYAPVHRPVTAAVGPAIGGLLRQIGVAHAVASDARAVLTGDGIAVVEATPANLASLAAVADTVRAWCARGNWLMLWGVTPEGLGDFNTLVRWRHVLRPFVAERVTLAEQRDPLMSGLTLRDVVMDTGKKMFSWMALRQPDTDEFSWIVDHTDIAPFCGFPSPTAMGKPSDTDPGADHWPRNMVNGFTSADNWSFCYTFLIERGDRLKWTLTLPQEERITALRIQPSRLYHPITRMHLYFDDDPTPVVAELRPEPVLQEVLVPGRRARRVTLEVAQWAERGDRDIVVIDNLWLLVERPEDYLRRVKPLLNIGGLMRYDEGRGGIVLNQLRLPENEVNPLNAEKKRTIAKTLLANLGAVFAHGKEPEADAARRYAPLPLPVERCTAYVVGGKQPGWWSGPADLGGLPVGEQTFAGVRYLLPSFDTSPVPTAFMLRGAGSTVPVERIDGLPADVRADDLHILATCAPSEPLLRRKPEEERKNPAVLLTCVLHYADGATADIPLRWQRELGPWISDEPVPLPEADIAWTAPAAGRHLAVWGSRCPNPRPDQRIVGIDLRAGEARWGSAAVFAITASTRTAAP